MKERKKSQERGLQEFLRKRATSFRNAFSGLKVLFKYEFNASIHLAVLIIVITAGIILRISPAEWLFVVFAAGLVFMAESFNSAIEHLSDEVSSHYSGNIKRAKDVAAAGVLISAIVSVIIGLIVFLPRIMSLF